LQEIVPITHIGQTAFAGEQGILTNRLITIYKKVRQHILTRSEFEVGDEQWV
jgi:4-amino-4-deoxychorismate lyase